MPLRLRDGRVEPIALEADPPFGSVPRWDYREQTLPLLPGDRIMFVSDGMLERNAANVDIAELMEAGAGLHPREAVQHLIRAVLYAVDGELADAAAALCLDWHGGPPRDRTSRSGADR